MCTDLINFLRNNFVCLFVEEIQDVYDYEIDSEGHAMEGYLFPDLESGDRVLVNLEEGETLTENGNEVKYIRLKIRKSRNISVRLEFKLEKFF